MNVRLQRIVVVAAVVVLVAVTGCGGSSGAPTTDPPVDSGKQVYASGVQFRARGVR